MPSNFSFRRSIFIAEQSYTLPLAIPSRYGRAVLFSLRDREVYDRKIYLWNSQQIIFMLNILLLWDEISPVFSKIEKSQVYEPLLSEVYCFSMSDSFINKFDTLLEAIAHARLLLEVIVEKANKIKVTQMNYLTSYEYLEQIDIYDLLVSGSQS